MISAGASVARDPLGAIKRKKQVHDRRLRMPLVQDNLCVIAPDLPNGEKTTVHVSISDAKNDSAVFEYIDGQLRIHHGSEYRVTDAASSGKPWVPTYVLR